MVMYRQGVVLPTTNAIEFEEEYESLSGSLARLVEFAPYNPTAVTTKQLH